MKFISSLLCASMAAGLALLAPAPAAQGAESWDWKSLAGAVGFPYDGGRGFVDAKGSAAQFFGPSGVAVDKNGTVYVADANNNAIRKISTTGDVTTFAGTGTAGSTDSAPGVAAKFKNPSGVAVDGNLTVYVADSYNQTIRKITAAGVVTTLAGTAGSSGSLDTANSPNGIAGFNYPQGIAVDAGGNVYVADTNNHTIRMINTAGVVKTVAGVAQVSGSYDTANSPDGVARFNTPFGLAVDAGGNLYVCDSGNHTIRKISLTRVVTTLAGTAGVAGATDTAPGVSALFSNPKGIAMDAGGNIYVTNTATYTIRRLTMTAGTAVVSTIGGTFEGTTGRDGVGAAARFNLPLGLAIDSTGKKLYVADPNRIVLGTSSGGTVTPPPSALAFHVIGSTANGANIRFSATVPTGPSVRVQSSSTPSVEASWTDLPDGHGGVMAEKPAGHFALFSTFYPEGDAVSFRAIAAKANTPDIISGIEGPYVLTRALLAIHETLASPRDPVGAVTHIGDTLTCTFTVVNGGTATARNLQVEAKVPTYMPNVLQNFDITTVGPKGATPGSTKATMATGDTSLLYAGMTLTQNKNPNLPTQTTITVASIIDDTHFTLSVAALASGTAETTFNYQSGQPRQFTARDITPSRYGDFVPATSVTANDAKVVWKMGALNKGYQQFVSFTIHLSSNVSTAQNPSFLRDYAVSSTSLQPPVPATGDSSGAATVGTQLAPGISMTMVRTSAGASVGPGDLITYTCTVSNFTSSRIANGAAVVEVPAHTRFGKSYPTGPGTSILGLSYPAKRGGPAGEQVFWTGLPAPRVVVPLMALAAHGKTGDTFSFNITFQVQWVDPSVVPTITTADFGAVFFDPVAFPVPLFFVNGVTLYEHRKEVDFFKGYYNLAATSTAGHPGTTDFFSLIDNANHDLAVYKNVLHSGAVPLLGSPAGGPFLVLGKVLKNHVTDTLDFGAGGKAVNIVQAGGYLTFQLTATNTGDAAADDVFIQDALPHDTAEEVPGQGADAASELFGQTGTVTLEAPPAGNVHHLHIRFDGLHLEPHSSICVEYTVRVDGGGIAPAPALLTNLDPPVAVDMESGLPASSSIGSSSTPHTWPGLYSTGSIVVVGPTSFAQPTIFPFPNNPTVSTNPAATAAALDALSALDRKDPIAPYRKVPGVINYFVLYENTSGHVVPNADLAVTLPGHTAFYQASFVNRTGTQIAPPAGASVVPPAGANNGRLATTGTVRFHFNSLAKGAGAVVLQLIVAPDAVQSTGSFIGGTDGTQVVLHDNPANLSDQKNASAPLPRCPVSTGGSVAAAAVHGFAPLTALADVPKIGILKIMPRAVPPGTALQPTVFPITWVIFNNGDTNSSTVDFHFIQPVGTAFYSVSHTMLYNGRSIVDGGGSPQPGKELETIWDGIPAHSALAVTYNFTVTGAAPGSIDENTSAVDVPFLGSLQTDATSTKIAAGAQVPSASDTTYTRAIAGNAIHCFTINQNPVLIVEIGNHQVFAEAASQIVGGGTNLTVSNGQSTVFGDASSIGIGPTTARYMLDHYADGTALAVVNASPATIVVPRGTSLLLDAALLAQKKITAIGVGGGAPLVSNGGGTLVSNGSGTLVSNGSGTLISNNSAKIIADDGATVISNDGGSVFASSGSTIIGQDGAGVIANKSAKIIADDGATIIAAGGGNLISTDSASLVAAGEGNLTSKTSGAVIGSAPGSSGIVSSGGGNIVAAGGGNLVATGGGN